MCSPVNYTLLAYTLCVVIVILGLTLPIGRTTALVTLRHRQHGSPHGTPGNTTGQGGGGEDAPAEYLVRQHEEAELACEAVNGSAGAAGVRWRHNGLAVDLGPGHRYSRDPLTGRLTIAGVRLEDDGIWQCEDRETGVAARPIWLVVLDPPRAPYLLIDGRRLDPGNQFVPVKENTDLTVECVSEGGRPSPSLQWALVPGVGAGLLDSLPGLQPSNDSGALGEARVARSEVRIARILRAHHNATVACLVNHATLAAPLNASLLLDVQYTPSFSISRMPDFGFPIREGIPVSLKCEVDSNPPASPVWQKDNAAPPVEQAGDGFLNFTSIRREHGGWYKCTSRHLLGDFSSLGYLLSVRYEVPEPEVTPGESAVSEEAAVEVSLGGVVQLQCPGKEGGCWGRLGRDGALDPVGPGPDLHVDRILYQEAGEYRCVVARSAKLEKIRSHNVHVSVTGGPVVYPGNRTVTVSTGARANLAVEFCANPPHNKAAWMVGSRNIYPGQSTPDGIFAHILKEGTGPNCHTSVLELSYVQPTDHGEYSFLVRSPRGVAEASIFVNVTRASGYVTSRAASLLGAGPLLLALVTTVSYVGVTL